MEGDTDYEFRCTAIEGYLDEKAAFGIGEWLRGAKRMYLQEYEESDNVPQKGLKALKKEEMERLREILSGYMEEVSLRGID